MANAAVGSYFATQGLRDRAITERARGFHGSEPFAPRGRSASPRVDAAIDFGGSPDLAELRDRAARTRLERESLEAELGRGGQRRQSPPVQGSPDLGAIYRRSDFYPPPTQPGSAGRRSTTTSGLTPPRLGAKDDPEDVVAAILALDGGLPPPNPADYSAVEPADAQNESSRHSPFGAAEPPHLAYHTRSAHMLSSYHHQPHDYSSAVASSRHHDPTATTRGQLPGDAYADVAHRIAAADDVESMLAAIGDVSAGAGNRPARGGPPRGASSSLYASDASSPASPQVEENPTIAAARRALRPWAAEPRAAPAAPTAVANATTRSPTSSVGTGGGAGGGFTGKQLAAELEGILARAQPTPAAAVGGDGSMAVARPAPARVVVKRSGATAARKQPPPPPTPDEVDEVDAATGDDGAGAPSAQGEPAPAMPPRASVVRISASRARADPGALQRRGSVSACVSPRFHDDSSDGSGSGDSAGGRSSSRGTSRTGSDEDDDRSYTYDTFTPTPRAHHRRGRARHIPGLASPSRYSGSDDDTDGTDDATTDEASFDNQRPGPRHAHAAARRPTVVGRGPMVIVPPVADRRPPSGLAPTERTEVIPATDFARMLAGGVTQSSYPTANPADPTRYAPARNPRQRPPLAPPPPPTAPGASVAGNAAFAPPLTTASGMPRSATALRGERHPALVDLSQVSAISAYSIAAQPHQSSDRQPGGSTQPPSRTGSGVVVMRRGTTPPPQGGTATPRGVSAERGLSASMRVPSSVVVAKRPNPGAAVASTPPSDVNAPEAAPKPPPVQAHAGEADGKDERVKSRGCFCC